LRYYRAKIIYRHYYRQLGGGIMYKLLIREIRESKKISQEQLSKLTSIPQSTISSIENRILACNLDELEEIAIALSLKIKDLFIEF
jgi:transcriptional regulator with XRE-family HTH domain